MFDEKALYDDIVRIWGEHGAHADLFRHICANAGVSLADEESTEQKIKRIFLEEGRNKLATIKRLRLEIDGLRLLEAKRLVEMYI